MLIAGYGLPVFPNEYACVVTIVTGVNKIKPCGEFPIKVIEEACNGTDRTIEDALYKMRTFYRNVEVL